MCSESTTAQLPPVKHHHIGIAEILTLQANDPRWGDKLLHSLDLYDIRRLPDQARAWLMRRFTRVL